MSAEAGPTLGTRPASPSARRGRRLRVAPPGPVAPVCGPLDADLGPVCVGTSARASRASRSPYPWLFAVETV